MMLLDRIEEKDKECYDKIFNAYKKVFLKKHLFHWTDDEIRENLESDLEEAYDLKGDFVYELGDNELDDNDLILNNLYVFAEFCIKNIDRLFW